MWVSELLPWTAKIVDEISLIKTVWTEAINRDPAVTYICTGHQLPGRASLGSWLSYGLGTMNQNLSAFVVMTASWSSKAAAQALYNRLWSAGFLPASTRKWPCARRAIRCSSCPLLQRRREPRIHPRPQRHDSALTGHRPPPPELQVPGPGHAAHGRRGTQSDQGNPGLSGVNASPPRS